MKTNLMKNFKLLLLIILINGLIGCSSPIENYELERLQKFCENHKGLRYVYKEAGTPAVVCNDGIGAHLNKAENKEFYL